MTTFSSSRTPERGRRLSEKTEVTQFEGVNTDSSTFCGSIDPPEWLELPGLKGEERGGITGAAVPLYVGRGEP